MQKESEKSKKSHKPHSRIAKNKSDDQIDKKRKFDKVSLSESKKNKFIKVTLPFHNLNK